MSAVLAVVLTVLKILGIVLAVILALVAVVLVLPVGLSLRYEGKTLELRLRAGPVRILLYPRASQSAAQARQGAAPEAAPAGPGRDSPKPAAPRCARAGESAAQAAGPAVPKASVAAPAGQPEKKAGEKSPNKNKASARPEKPGLVERVLGAFRSNPVEFLSHLFSLVMAAGGWLLHGVRITRLRVLWTVTREDASDTAITYGRAVAALNTALAVARDHMKIESEELRLEPDFTGERAAQRRISFELFTRPVIVLVIGVRLMRRFLHDPVLFPKA
ncbi:MAG: DUF2953 domain-containing protein [bacterium]|nr:DUF2953 domain-containing protein [bacterium]